jgi:hypothetical protein
MTFARAIGYFNPESTFDPQENSQELVWEWRTLWADQTWTFDVVVQIGEHIPPATDLLNQIKACQQLLRLPAINYPRQVKIASRTQNTIINPI